MKYRPRNDFVLVKRVNRGSVRGVVMPDQAAEGKELHVVAVGPDVKGLEPGDVVMGIGTPNVDVIRVHGEADLYITRQQNIILTVHPEED